MVTVRSKPSEVASAGLLRLETWTNLGTEEQNLSADRLLAVFVKVRHRRTTRMRHCRTNLLPSALMSRTSQLIASWLSLLR